MLILMSQQVFDKEEKFVKAVRSRFYLTIFFDKNVQILFSHDLLAAFWCPLS